ncbi:DUF2934 domain-containing protein [Agrobacterium tumefaciens]|nr:DUF2934 domain-containing protein [Agrobacterium tumefaciens]
MQHVCLTPGKSWHVMGLGNAGIDSCRACAGPSVMSPSQRRCKQQRETSMQVSENEWISKRAYTLWEKEGHPHGRDADHWAQAKHEFSLLKTSEATKPAQRKKAAPKAVSAEAAPDVEAPAKPKARARKAAAAK